MRSGFIGLIGRPNVGKSTLLNSIIGRKVAITSDKPQTTRKLIHGIYTTDSVQMVFVDTPGIHKPKTKLGKVLNKEAYYSVNDVDIILWLVDITEELGKGDLFVLDVLKNTDKPALATAIIVYWYNYLSARLAVLSAEIVVFAFQ